MYTSIPDTYTLAKQLREVERQRDHIRALMADFYLRKELSALDADWCMRAEHTEGDSEWWDRKADIKGALEAKIAKRAARRAQELAVYGTYIRPGPWDNDLDDYQESSYEMDAGDGYSIRLNRQYDGTWNGYVILPDDHRYNGKSYDFFDGAPVALTYASWNTYGFYFGSAVKPYPEYTVFTGEMHFSAEKMEYGSHIDYANMRGRCMELVEYFKALLK